jgi:signal transduction histidine kinase
LAFESSDVNESAEVNQRIRQILHALRGTELARLIASDAVKAEIDLAAFHGDIDWETQLDPRLVASARAAKVRIVVVHYDKFTDEGAPLAVRL